MFATSCIQDSGIVDPVAGDPDSEDDAWAAESTTDHVGSVTAEVKPSSSTVVVSPSTFAERTDEDMDPMTAIVSRGSADLTPLPTGGSSSDPPTRFLRGVDEHIDLPNGSMVDDYEIDAKLGAGAMGVVYGARHMTLGQVPFFV